jgi:hypothetical protein
MIRRILTAAGATTVSSLPAMGWSGVVALIGLVLVFAAVLCWVIADADRPARLALLLAACRRTSPTPPAAAVVPHTTRSRRHPQTEPAEPTQPATTS